MERRNTGKKVLPSSGMGDELSISEYDLLKDSQIQMEII